MIYPRLPTVPTGRVSQIDPSWFQRLNECLQFAMTHPVGDGSTIFQDAGGTLRAAGGRDDLVALPDSLFRVTLQDDGTLSVGPGFLNRNGLDFISWPGAEKIAPKSGYLCIVSEPVDKRGNWSDPEILIRDTPNQCAYPVAKITVEGEAVSWEQYPVTVAQIIYSGRCPIAEL